MRLYVCTVLTRSKDGKGTVGSRTIKLEAEDLCQARGLTIEKLVGFGWMELLDMSVTEITSKDVQKAGITLPDTKLVLPNDDVFRAGFQMARDLVSSPSPPEGADWLEAEEEALSEFTQNTMRKVTG